MPCCPLTYLPVSFVFRAVEDPLSRLGPEVPKGAEILDGKIGEMVKESESMGRQALRTPRCPLHFDEREGKQES